MKIIKTFEEFINSKTVEKPEEETSAEDIQTAPGDNAGDEEIKKDIEEPSDDVTAGAESPKEEEEDDKGETIELDSDDEEEDEEDDEEEDEEE